ncbi:MAG TPA: glycosyltransferase family 39 protein [Victivallales bacterium]|nr:glycosyltransferase family 39 protein [Victivallales bacterium]
MLQKSNIGMLRMQEKNLFHLPVIIAFFLAIVILIFFMRHSIICLSFPFPLEYGEGITANYTALAVKGENIYPVVKSSLPWLHNPYGPLFFYFSAIFAKFTNNPFLPGRIVSFISAILVFFLIFFFARERVSVFAALASVLLFVSSPVVWRYSTMGRVDFLALVMMSISIFLLYKVKRISEDVVKSENTNLSSILVFLSSLFAFSAVIVKPSYLPIVFSGFIVSLNFSKRDFIIFISGIFSGLFFFLAWIMFTSQTAIFIHWTKMNMIGFSFANFAKILFIFMRTHLFTIILFIFAIYNFRRDKILGYFSIASGIIAFLTIKNGAIDSYFLPLLLCASFSAANFVSNYNFKGANYVFSSILAVQLGFFLPISPTPVFTATYGFDLPPSALNITPSEDDFATGNAIINEIKSVDEPVLCDEPGYLLCAGKDIYIQPYQYGMLARKNIIEKNLLEDAINNNFFSLYIIRSAKGSNSYFSEEVINLFKSKYPLKTTIGNYNIYGD